ncbi:MAG: GHKL domain-containing protein, partial [Clostridia bacterium]|nr:GHKL domain-containing protein [Clostridia bacterium]
AHEINNPINGIMNYAQIILDNHQDDEETAGYATEIIEESNRVAGIVRSLLQFSRQTEQNYSPVDIKDIVNDTMSLIKTTILKDNIEVIYDIGEDLPKVICRKQEIRQVLMNLITNARDAVALIEGDKKITIASEVAHSGKDRFLRLMIRDNGQGIADDIADKIFDPFFTTKSRDKGTGLGLSISYGIVREHGGHLKFNSRSEVGTEFIMELPCE